MSCYQLSNGLCSKVEGMICRFYWGDDTEKRGLHWLKWGRLNYSKADGVSVNVTLRPSIQHWWQKTDGGFILTLFLWLAESLNRFIFLLVNFLTTKKRYWSSFAWSSTYKAGQVMREGSAWYIGDGRCVKVWEDRGFLE